VIHIKEQKIGLNLNSDTELLDSYFDIIKELIQYVLMFLKTYCTNIYRL